jgi:hypothetical protein
MVRWRLWSRRIGIGLVVAHFSLAPLLVGEVGAEEQWVQNYVPTELWSGPGPDAVSFGGLRQFTYLRLHSEQIGDRFYVYNPRAQNFAYVDASAVGPSHAPPPEYLMRPRVLETLNVPARSIGTSSIYRETVVDDALWSHDVYHNAPLMVRDKVEGEDESIWYRLEDGTFVGERDVRVPAPQSMRPGRWIDVTLSAPTIVTAYENGKAIYSALAIHGVGGWETPIGTYVIQQRVANERMRGPGYDVSNVLFTQYFTGAGHSIHYNYWSSNWGYAGSHGCLGMTYDDSLWFWNWSTIGTPVVIHW